MPIQGPVRREITQLIAAGAVLDALAQWQYETPDVTCMIEVLERATAVGLVSILSSGGDTLKQQSNVASGGTAGVPPGRLNVDPITGKAQASQKLQLLVTNPTGGGITYDAVTQLTPLGGGGGGRGGARRPPPRRRRR